MIDQTTRWGILGTGNISHQFARGLQNCANAELVAIGSRSIEKAREFGGRFGIRNCHGSYEQLVEDPAVDVVYIGTPHPLHRDNMVLALQAGKAVLCEKPLAIDAQQAQEAIDLAGEKNLFLMEAMWTRFLPPIAEMRQILSSGLLGEVRMVSADLGFQMDRDPHRWQFNSELGGGCLLDVGIYPIWLAISILGIPKEIIGEASIGSTGVDEQDSIAMRFDKGRLACLFASIQTTTPQQACIMCTGGMIHLYSHWWKGGPMRVTHGKRAWVSNVRVEGNGYQYEAAEVGRCLREGKTQSDVMPLSESLAVLRTMDQLRALWGLKYPAENNSVATPAGEVLSI